MEKDKLFVLTKFIKAKSVLEAIKKDAKTPVHECCIDSDWKKNLQNDLSQLTSAIGFEQEDEEGEEKNKND